MSRPSGLISWPLVWRMFWTSRKVIGRRPCCAPSDPAMRDRELNAISLRITKGTSVGACSNMVGGTLIRHARQQMVQIGGESCPGDKIGADDRLLPSIVPPGLAQNGGRGRRRRGGRRHDRPVDGPGRAPSAAV